jgi:hypothetical protein
VHAVQDFDDIKLCVCENEFPVPSKIKVEIEMHPEGTKNFQVTIEGIKLFVYPYFYLMINHFFSENLPTYDMKSADIPNEYTEDYEEAPEMNLAFKLQDSLICLANTN